MDNGGLRYGATESALRPPLPTATPPPFQAAPGGRNRTVLTDPARTNIFTFDPRKQTSGGRHQIGTPAGFKSESVAGFRSESLAGFVGIRMERHLLVKRARAQGFVVFDHAGRWEASVATLAAWVRSGQLRWREDILDGLESCPDALAGLYRGENRGKRLIRV